MSYPKMPTGRPPRRVATEVKAATAAQHSSSEISDAPMSNDHKAASPSLKKTYGKVRRVAKKTTTTKASTIEEDDDDDKEDDAVQTPSRNRRNRPAASSPSSRKSLPTTPPPKSSQSLDPLSPSYPAFPEFISTPSKLHKKDLELAHAPLEEPPEFMMEKKTFGTKIKRPQKDNPEGIPGAKKNKTTSSSSPPVESLPSLISKYEIPSDLLDIPSDYSTDSDSAPRPSASMASGLPSKILESDSDDDSLPDLPDLSFETDDVVLQTKEDAELDEATTRRDSKLADGTLVYYKDNRRDQYWPGRIVGYEPATNSRKKGERYIVLDIISASENNKVMKTGKDMQCHKKRKEIFCYRDEGIATCALGDVEIKALREPEQSDADHRESTPPLPNDIDLLTSTEFEDLSYAQQIQAIRPQLQLVIAEQYPPAQKSIDDVYKGEWPPSMKGDIPDAVIEDVFMPELRRWALRGERWGKFYKGEEQARPVGSRRYEEMTPEQRDAFVIRLLPAEAVRQICIKINEYEKLTADELHELIDDFHPTDDFRRLYMSYSHPQLVRRLAEYSIEEQAEIRDTQTQESIMSLREARKAMRKKLGVQEPNESVANERGTNEPLVDAQGRPVRHAAGRRARLGVKGQAGGGGVIIYTAKCP